jgi:hypothetical protein
MQKIHTLTIPMSLYQRFLFVFCGHVSSVAKLDLPGKTE